MPILNLSRADFDGNWLNAQSCPIARAAKKYFITDDVLEWINVLYVDDKYLYKHEAYGSTNFDDDIRTLKLNPDKDPIRIIELIPVNEMLYARKDTIISLDKNKDFRVDVVNGLVGEIEVNDGSGWRELVPEDVPNWLAIDNLTGDGELPLESIKKIFTKHVCKHYGIVV